ncbi:MAG TPA: hypothetical protein VD794_15450 [Flavisolibacter sp.]|nr:hypothetical protein [Flavisolibacter sp.]
MLLHQFNQLCEGKYRHLILKGICVAERFTQDEDYLLFQLTDSYVEVVFCKQFDQIIRVNCFRDTNTLHPYLEEMNIEAIYR